jgi:hypothetical protein
MTATPFFVDGVTLLITSALAAGFVVVWLSLVAALSRRSRHAALLALLVVPAPSLAWRAGYHMRAVALVVLAATYAALRIALG